MLKKTQRIILFKIGKMVQGKIRFRYQCDRITNVKSMDFLNDTSETSIKCVINDLPDEVLGYILGLLRPYKDLKECMLVCKRWNRIALGK